MQNTLLGVQIGPRSLPEIVAISIECIRARAGTFIFACANPHSLVMTRRDAAFRRALQEANAVVADGVGCQVAARLAGVPVGPRITGSDYFRAMMSHLDVTEGRAYFFGSNEAVLGRLAERVAADFPRVQAAYFSPPYRAWSDGENEQMLERIWDFRPQVLWVGMTAPKQEKWVNANRERLQVPVVASIGAVFDYYAGVVRRAPDWICHLGLEWLYRLPREWRRLWRRTFVSAPAFLWYVVLQRLGDSSKTHSS